jgi:hypothetical protein
MIKFSFRQRWIMAVVAICLTAIFVFLHPTTALAQNGTVPVEAYWEQIAAIHDLVKSLDNESPETQQVRLRNAADELAQISTVTLSDGRLIPVQHQFLIARLRAEAPDLEELGSILQAFLDIQNRWAEPRFDQLDEEILADILARPEFQYEEPEPTAFQKWWADVRERFWAFFLQLIPSGAAGGLLGDTIIIVGTIALAAILFYAFRGLLLDFTADASLTDDDDLDDEPLTAEIALNRAQALSAGGDYRSAVRYLYLSSLLLLEERGLLRYDRSLTNREYLRSVSHRPELATVLRDVIDVFDRVWYGFQPLTTNQYNQYAVRVEALKKQKERT